MSGRRRVFAALAVVVAAVLLLPGRSARAFSWEAMDDYEEMWKSEGTPYFWAAADINEAICYELFLGYPRGTYPVERAGGRVEERLLLPEFRPQGMITRAEYAAILARAAGFGKPPETQSGFADVPPEAWYSGYVAALAAEGVVRAADYASGLLRPGESVTRLEIAVWAARVCARLGLAVPEVRAAFLDVPADGPFFAEICRAVGAGIVRGYPDGTFRPEAPANRAEAASMIMRLVRQLTQDPPDLAVLRAAIEGGFNALTEFEKRHREPLPPDELFQAEFGEWFTAPNLVVYVVPKGESKWCDHSLGALTGGGSSIGSGYLNLRTRDRLCHYSDRILVSAEPVWLGSRWAAVRVVWITYPRTYDRNPGIPGAKWWDVLHLKLDADGKWKSCGVTLGERIEIGFDLK